MAAPTVQTVLDDLRRITGDTKANAVTDALGIDVLNIAHRLVASEVEWMVKHKGLSLVKDSPFVTLPADFIKFSPWGVKNKNLTDMPIGSEHDYQQGYQMYRPDKVGTPMYVFVQHKEKTSQFEAIVSPTPDAADPSSTINLVGGINATVTEVTLASVSSFIVPCIIKIDSEDILALQKDSTNNKLKRLVRGYSGTTAATHANGATVTQYGLQMRYVRYGATYVNTTAGLATEIEWPDHDRMSFVHYAAHILYSALEDEAKATLHLRLSGFLQGAMREDVVNLLKGRSISLSKHVSPLTSGRPPFRRPYKWR